MILNSPVRELTAYRLVSERESWFDEAWNESGLFWARSIKKGNEKRLLIGSNRKLTP